MDPQSVTDFLPLGGASVLLIYLLRLISYERARWIRERATLIEEHRVSMEQKRQQLERCYDEQERRDRIHENLLLQWNKRYDDLRRDYDRLLREHERGGGRDR